MPLLVWIGALLMFLALRAHADEAAPRADRLPTPGVSRVLSSRLVRVPGPEVPLRVPDGFRVTLFAEHLEGPREMARLPNGDLLVGEIGAGRVTRLSDTDGDGRADRQAAWVDGLNTPYGIVVRDGFAYVANTDSVVRFPLQPDGSAGPPQPVIARLEYAGVSLAGGHATRDILFSRDGRRLFVSVGSKGNNDENPPGRAAILVYDADNGAGRLFATGLRNPVSIAWRPDSDELWTTVNERDRLGNDLVPDYVTSVRPAGFYGWPYYYIGPHVDPRYAQNHPGRAAQVLVPDVLIQAHSAPLGLAFYDAAQFPLHYHGGLFVGLHGSWNRDPLVGYKVVFVPFRDGKPAGEPEDFLTGFIKSAATGEVYGRPVAPYVWSDGSLLVSDDSAGRLWRIAWRGPTPFLVPP